MNQPAPIQPFLPTREEMMRLNALNLAVQFSNGIVDPAVAISTAKQFFSYLACEEVPAPKKLSKRAVKSNDA